MGEIRQNSSSESDGERRWIVVTTDGSYVTLGRYSDPSLEELRAVEEALISRGISGWLAIMDGNPWGKSAPKLMGVRPLAGAEGAFDAVASNCLQRIAQERLAVKSARPD
jgi:hypothetical protein